MAYTQTTRLDLDKAVPGSNQVFETTVINDNWDKIDAEAVAIDARLDSVEADITTIEGDITTIQGDITTIQGDISDLEASIPTVYQPQVTTVSGTTYALLASDASDFLRFTSSSPVTVTVNNLSVGQYVNCLQDGDGKITFTGGVGVTIQSVAGGTPRTTARYTWASIICIAAATYRIVGSLEAV